MVFVVILQIFGRNLFWYAAVFGTITAISRAAMVDEILVLDPQGAMSLVVQHTHYMPKRWRVKENAETVRLEFETLFQVSMSYAIMTLPSIFVQGFPRIQNLECMANDAFFFF